MGWIVSLFIIISKFSYSSYLNRKKRYGYHNVVIGPIPAMQRKWKMKFRCHRILLWKEGSSISRIKTDIWSQACLIGFMFGLPNCPVHDLNILLVQKGCHVTCCVGWGIVLDHKVTSKHSRHPWQHLIHQNLDVLVPVHGSIHHDQLILPPWWIASHTMTDGPRFPSLGWTQASIRFSPCHRRTPTRLSLWYRENRDSSLGIQCF